MTPEEKQSIKDEFKEFGLTDKKVFESVSFGQITKEEYQKTIISIFIEVLAPHSPSKYPTPPKHP